MSRISFAVQIIYDDGNPPGFNGGINPSLSDFLEWLRQRHPDIQGAPALCGYDGPHAVLSFKREV